jgi:organic hydroperoxide reductase OsmC/OhrA
MNEIPEILTPLYASQAKSVGGREGYITTEDGVLSLELTQAWNLGGRERAGATNP